MAPLPAGATTNAQGDIQYNTSGNFDLQYTPDGGAYSPSTGVTVAASALGNQQKAMMGANPFSTNSTTPTDPSIPPAVPTGAQAGAQAASSTTTPSQPASNQSSPTSTGYQPNVSYAQAQANVQNGVPQAQQAQVQADLANAYGQAHTQLSATGTPPADGTRSTINDALTQNTPQTQDTSQAQAVIDSNQAHQQYLQDYQQSMSSQAQSESLVQQYQDFSNQLGLPALNTELMNMNNVINGTEQDVRNEVTAAGGFATESQVLALSTARNKTLIQNYNTLLQTRNDLQTNLSTMMGLAEQDRAFATQQIDSKLNFDQQQITYADKAVTNGQSALSSMQQSEGWDGIYKAALATGDPQAVQRINSLMGNGFDLSTMANQDAQARAQAQSDTALKNEQLQATLANTKATTAKTNAETNKTNADIKNMQPAVTPTANLPYNSNYSSAKDYVNKVLTAQGVSYQTASANTPKGFISAIDNSTGQTVQMTSADYKSKGSGYTVIYNNS